MARQPQRSTSTARALRQSATEPEVWLWQRLRAARLDGLRFRRQHPVGPYILDFYCPSAQLAVELDGSGHLDRVAQDEERTRWLQDRGVKVLRFWNHELSAQPEAVLEAIRDAILDRSTRVMCPPNPQPAQNRITTQGP